MTRGLESKESEEDQESSSSEYDLAEESFNESELDDPFSESDVAQSPPSHEENNELCSEDETVEERVSYSMEELKKSSVMESKSSLRKKQSPQPKRKRKAGSGSDKKKLKRKRRKRDIGSEAGSCLCPICGSSYINSKNPANSLRYHIRYVHSLVPRFPCNEPGCTSLFKRKSDLKNHQVVHTKERSVPCSVEGCNQRFTSPHVAKFHLRTHERERSRVACEKCEKTYLYESTLRHHILTHHDPKYVKKKRRAKITRTQGSAPSTSQTKLIEKVYSAWEVTPEIEADKKLVEVRQISSQIPDIHRTIEADNIEGSAPTSNESCSSNQVQNSTQLEIDSPLLANLLKQPGNSTGASVKSISAEGRDINARKHIAEGGVLDGRAVEIDPTDKGFSVANEASASSEDYMPSEKAFPIPAQLHGRPPSTPNSDNLSSGVTRKRRGIESRRPRRTVEMLNTRPVETGLTRKDGPASNKTAGESRMVVEKDFPLLGQLLGQPSSHISLNLHRETACKGIEARRHVSGTLVDHFPVPTEIDLTKGTASIVAPSEYSCKNFVSPEKNTAAHAELIGQQSSETCGTNVFHGTTDNVFEIEVTTSPVEIDLAGDSSASNESSRNNSESPEKNTAAQIELIGQQSSTNVFHDTTDEVFEIEISTSPLEIDLSGDSTFAPNESSCKNFESLEKNTAAHAEFIGQQSSKTSDTDIFHGTTHKVFEIEPSPSFVEIDIQEEDDTTASNELSRKNFVSLENHAAPHANLIERQSSETSSTNLSHGITDNVFEIELNSSPVEIDLIEDNDSPSNEPHELSSISSEGYYELCTHSNRLLCGGSRVVSGDVTGSSIEIENVDDTFEEVSRSSKSPVQTGNSFTSEAEEQEFARIEIMIPINSETMKEKLKKKGQKLRDTISALVQLVLETDENDENYVAARPPATHSSLEAPVVPVKAKSIQPSNNACKQSSPPRELTIPLVDIRISNPSLFEKYYSQERPGNEHLPSEKTRRFSSRLLAASIKKGVVPRKPL